MYANVPGYKALIIRRTYKQLAKADSILGKAKEWLFPLRKTLGLHWNGGDHAFTFPSGATLEFGHMDHDGNKIDYQGGAWHFIGVDEATQFTESMISYPRSRQRRDVGVRVPIRWRGGSNPGGIGHDHIKARYVEPFKLGKQVPNRRFFPATLSDNPNIDCEEYTETLRDSGLDPITLAQLLAGDWDAVAGGKFNRDWFRFYRWSGNLTDYCVLIHPEHGERPFKPCERQRFLTVDPASSAKTTADWTVISAWCVSPWADLVWLGCVRVQRETPDITPLIQQEVLIYRPGFVGIEAVAGNRAVLQLAQRAKSPAIITRELTPHGKDKLVNATPAINLAASGRLYLPCQSATFPLDAVIGELTRFTGIDGEDANDDIVDTLGQAAQCIMSGMENKPGRPQVLGGSV